MVCYFALNTMHCEHVDSLLFRISYSQVAAIIERNVVRGGRASIVHAWNEHAFRVLASTTGCSSTPCLRVYILQFATPLPTTSSSTAVNKYTKIVPPMLLFK